MSKPYATTTTLAPERAIAAAEHFFGKEFHCAPEQHDAHVLAYRGGGGHVTVRVLRAQPTTLEIETSTWDLAVRSSGAAAALGATRASRRTGTLSSSRQASQGGVTAGPGVTRGRPTGCVLRLPPGRPGSRRRDGPHALLHLLRGAGRGGQEPVEALQRAMLQRLDRPVPPPQHHRRFAGGQPAP